MLDRRDFLTACSATGAGGTLFPGVLWAMAQDQATVTREMIGQAEKVAGIEFTDAQRDQLVTNLSNRLRNYERIRALEMPNSVAPALHFDPVLPGMSFPSEQRPLRFSRPSPTGRPADLEEVAFWPVTRLAELIRSRQVMPSELTAMYLSRLKRHDPTLLAVVTPTEERARHRPRCWTTNCARAGIEARCMASRGVRRTCWRREAIPPHGARRRTATRCWTTMPRWWSVSTRRVRCSWRS
jgi:hypothetical protein